MSLFAHAVFATCSSGAPTGALCKKNCAREVAARAPRRSAGVWRRITD